jgi:hypothetical protein
LAKAKSPTWFAAGRASRNNGADFTVGLISSARLSNSRPADGFQIVVQQLLGCVSSPSQLVHTADALMSGPTSLPPYRNEIMKEAAD